MEPLIAINCSIHKKFGRTTFQFWGHWSQRTFRKSFNLDFKFCCFSGTWSIILKKKVTFCNAEFNAESNGTNFKSQKPKTRKFVCPFLIAFFNSKTNLITNNGFSIISNNLGKLGSWEFFPSQSEAEKIAGSDKKEGKC